MARDQPLRSRAIASVILLNLVSVALAVTVYRWTDEQGRVHYGENVPERYRRQARPIDAPATAPNDDEQRAANARAASDKARAAEMAASRAVRAEAATAAKAKNAAASTVVKRPATVPDSSTDCATWQRLYQESLDCFGPYRTVRGAVKPEAFTQCNEVPEPPPTRCRTRLP